MNLDELRSVQSKERRKDSLQQLRDSFYQDVAAYIQDLRAERDRRAEQVDNPFSDDEVRQLSDKLDTAEEVAEALYERRVGKVVKLASFAAADMSASEEGMTVEEQELFDDLVARIKQNKTSVLDVLAGEQPANTSPATNTTDSPVSTPTESPSTAESPTTAPDNTTTIGGTNPDSESTPTPPEADTKADDVLASAMGGAAESESGTPERQPAGEPANDPGYDDGSDAALGDTPPTDTTDNDDGVPTPDGGSAVQSAQPSDTPATQATSPSSAAPESGASPTPQPEATEPPTESTTPPESNTTTDTAMAAPDAESAATEPAVTESPSTEPAGTESTPTGTTATAATAEPESAAESTANESAPQSAHQEPDTTTEPVAAAADTTPRTVVRITDDVGTIFGVDEREYTLQAEDIVTLPTPNAEVLLQQDAATKLE